MSTRKAILISNPKTGRYGSRRTTSIQALATHLQSLGVDVELLMTTGPGDAAAIAERAAKEGIAEVIVAGGDGTINEAVQGLAGTNTRLGIIPRGTANVLARELELPLDGAQAVEVVARGRTRSIHVGVAIDEVHKTRRYFLLMAGIGLDASVVRRVRPALKKIFGKGAFWFSGLSHLAKWNPKAFLIEAGGQSYDATFAAIGNARSYGGDLAITPRARLDQPEFEVCIIDTFSRLRYLSLLSYAMRSGMPRNKEEGARFLQTNRVKAIGEAPVQVDGELIGQLPMTFEIAKQSIEIIVPEIRYPE